MLKDMADTPRIENLTDHTFKKNHALMDKALRIINIVGLEILRIKSSTDYEYAYYKHELLNIVILRILSQTLKLHKLKAS